MAATLETLDASVKLLSKTVASSQTDTDTVLAEIRDLNVKFDQILELLQSKSGGRRNGNDL